MKNLLQILILISLFLITGCSRTAVNHTVLKINPGNKPLKTAVIEKKEPFEKIDARAFNYYVNGNIYEELGDFASASISYKNALQVYPTSHEIRYSLANIYYKIQNFADVLETLEVISPEDELVYEMRANCHRALGQDNQAKTAYLKVVEYNPKNAMAYSYLASYYRREMKLDSIIWAYNNLTRIRPGNHRIWSELGKLQIQINSLAEAKVSFKESIRLSKDRSNLMAVIQLGEIYEIEGIIDSALHYYKTGLTIQGDDLLLNRMISNLYVHLDSAFLAIPHAKVVVESVPTDKGAIRRLASIYYAADSLHLSDSVFSSLVSIGDRHPANFYYLGRISIRQEDYQSAKTHFINLTQVADSSADSWLDLGITCRKLEQTDEEIDTYINGINHMKDEKSAVKLLFALGAAYENAGKYEKSIEVFKEIIAKVPNHDQAMNYLGYMFADKGENLKYAQELIENALSISPENVAYLDSYGWLFFRLGDFDQALYYLKKAVALDNDPVIFDHLGDAYKAKGNHNSANESWERALDLSPDDEKIKEKLKR